MKIRSKKTSHIAVTMMVFILPTLVIFQPLIGANRVNKAFGEMIRALFSIGDGAAKIPGVKVTRTFR